MVLPSERDVLGENLFGEEKAITTTMHDAVKIVELHEAIQLLCLKAFETISTKFPHYKSFYRLAEVRGTITLI